MPIEGHEGPDQGTPVQNRDPHAVVHVLQHLAAPRHRLEKKKKKIITEKTQTSAGRDEVERVKIITKE